MITSARWFTWITLFYSAFLMLYALGHWLDGSVLIEIDDGRESRTSAVILFSAVVAVLSGVGIKLLHPGRLMGFSWAHSLVPWLEHLPYRPPFENFRFYLTLVLLTIPTAFTATNLDWQRALLTCLALPFAAFIGWFATCLGLWVQALNPIVWFFPRLMVFGCLLFHFVSIIGVVIGVSLSPFRDYPQEAPFALAFLAGSAVAASHVLRFWAERSSFSQAA